MYIKNGRSKKLKIFLISIGFIIFGLVVAIFAGYKIILDKHDNFASFIHEDADISIGKVHQTFTRNGVTEWSIDAESVRFVKKKEEAFFQDLYVTFFLKNNNKIYLKADHGVLKTDSNDMEVSGDVVLKNDTCKLNTKELYYNHKQRIISSRVPVKITGDSFDLTADSMSYNLNTNKAVLDRRVEGVFDAVNGKALN